MVMNSCRKTLTSVATSADAEPSTTAHCGQRWRTRHNRRGYARCTSCTSPCICANANRDMSREFESSMVLVESEVGYVSVAMVRVAGYRSCRTKGKGRQWSMVREHGSAQAKEGSGRRGVVLPGRSRPECFIAVGLHARATRALALFSKTLRAIRGQKIEYRPRG